MHSILAARTDFSLGESILSPEKLIDLVKEVGEKAVALTDTMCVTGMIDFSSRAVKAGIKPVVGVRLRLTDNPTWRPADGEKKKHMPPDYFLTVYALTEAGIKAIFRLLTLANSEDRFYYVAKLGFQDLWSTLDGLGRRDVAVHLGDGQSVMAHAGIDGICAELNKRLDLVYAALVPIDTPYYGRMNAIAVDLVSRGLARPLVVKPVLYEEHAADFQEIMAAIIDNIEVSNGRFRSRHNRDLHPKRVVDLARDVVTAAQHLAKRGVNASAIIADGLRNTDELVDAVNYIWSDAPVSLPKMAPDEFQAVTQACKIGWQQRFAAPVFGHQPSSQELAEVYMPRLKYELEILRKLNFSGYFLLVQDIVVFAKSNGILVGPGRGSVGGSLVAYLMGITDCDPIRFNLMFERFINPDRIDLPDADLDFMSERRHEIVSYLTGKYGAARVAGVSNFSTLAAASAIRSVGSVMGLGERDYSVSKLVPKLHGANVSLPDCRKQVPEIDAFAETNAAIWPIMERLEGTMRNFAQHAAGVVVAGEDLVERGVVERGSVICWDKQIVEKQGLVKVDILGLSTLDLIQLTLDYIKERHGRTVDLNRIPLDDPKVLGHFARGETTAIFQFESGGMRRLLKELGYTGTLDFEDITAATALYRPGPMESGMMDSFYKRKQGDEVIEYDHPLMAPILESTFGVIVYQEQVMRISQVIAGYSGAEADKLRKIMGKKLPEEMAKERGKFVEGCVKTIGADEQWAGQLFDKIEGFAGYGFNRSHSIEYTLISYQCMWLKTNYPVEFYAAALTKMDADKLPALLRDAKAAGITVDMPDINHSTDRFEIVTDTRLVVPFQKIKGISEKTAAAIMAARASGAFASKADFVARVERRKCNVRHQDCLDKVGAFANIEPGQEPSNHPSRVRDQIDLVPGLVSDTVPINRDMHSDKVTRTAIGALVDEYRGEFGPGAEDSDGMPVKPGFGKQARFMLISDCPGRDEDAGGIMGFSVSNSAVEDAMAEAGLDKKDAYWTALVKRPKRVKTLTPEEIARYAPYLAREIGILQPPVIVLLGSSVVRHFMPDFKGKVSEFAGKIVYSRELDANLVIGFSAGEIWHDPSKQTNMNEVFAAVAKLMN